MRHFTGLAPATLMLVAMGATVGSVAGQTQEKTKEHRERYPFITDAENRLIQDYYRAGSGHIPPGLAKRGATPPVLAKQLHRAGVVPPGLEKALELLPEDLDRRLAPVPAGYLRRICGMMVLLLQVKSNLIVDTIEIVRQ